MMDCLVCPACGYIFVDDELDGLITYRGEGPPVEHDCPGCKTLLVIDEQVERTFEVTIATVAAGKARPIVSRADL